MIYKNVANILKNKINHHTYNTGDALPCEKTLATDLNVSRNTLRKALKLLAQEGIIERVHGSGTYIKEKNFIAHMDHMNSFSEIAHKAGKIASSQILKFEMQPASVLVAGGLNIAVAEPVYYIKRLRLIDNIVMQVEETWMSVNRFPALTIAHMKSSKFSFIEKECGVTITGTFETFSPTLPTPELAEILRISTKDPILQIQTQAIDINQQPVDYSILYSNSFEFQVKYFFPR
ncbi:GntR family transcriptional regulator [Superficieibacter electus]|uniref:GntR family transcriptional regulator n=1 Tax=Superficieibacter electus TaxID=2022662 RepID=A0A2P5GI08_9ENTR|nr:GntR family transcriptional regulator [Superficieibacter electus]POP42429.1 GntR family transcriptional regulator [Superficieibacter electus]POP47951.1 GntR family transcriptional regulator [Superficieibacter electus]